MDVTPLIPDGQNIIKGYGDKAFNINDETHNNSLILFPDKLFAWDITDIDDIAPDALDVILQDNSVEILLIGCGDVHKPLPHAIYMRFQQANIGVEIMTTGAACRTYNVLLSEGRNVAAALILV